MSLDLDNRHRRRHVGATTLARVEHRRNCGLTAKEAVEREVATRPWEDLLARDWGPLEYAARIVQQERATTPTCAECDLDSDGRPVRF